MFETELKFQLDATRREAVRRAVLGSGTAAQAIRLQARYFDTPDARLAASGLALRLRREGRSRWVQTLKGRGDGMIRRLEHEVVLPAGAAARLDLARHAGTPAGDALQAALGAQTDDLVERFATDIRRTRRVLRATGSRGERATVEAAFDEGFVTAAIGGKASRLAVAELEFELIEGSPQALLALAARWVPRYGLWLDVRSKAERGHALATGLAAAAVTAQPPVVSRSMRPRRALAAMLQATLSQVLPNLAVVADAEQAESEHVHQLRIGLRRLRTALREFGEAIDGVDVQWAPELALAFRALGPLRDREVVAGLVSTACAAAREAGLDPSAAPPVPALDPQDTAALRAPGLQRVLLALIGLVLAGDVPARGRPLLDVARKRLARLHKRVVAAGARFDTLDATARHALRARMKRLRYSLEYVAPLFAGKAVAQYLALLKSAQDVLGDCNDVAMAIATYDASPRSVDEAFVLGWLSGRQEALSAAAQSWLQALSAARRLWKT